MNEEEDLIHEEPEEPETPEEPVTFTDQFIEKLAAYPDKDTAKVHIREIAKELGCAKSLGYTALNRLDRKGHWKKGKPEETPPIEAVEPIVEIAEVETEDLEEEPPEDFEEEEITEEEVTEEERPPPTFPMTLDKLEFNISLAFKKIADVTKYPEFALEPKESKGLAEAWYPVLETYAPQALGNPAVWAGVTTLVVVVPRVIGYAAMRAKKKKEELPPPPPEPEPEPETKEEPPLETPEETAEEKARKEREQKPPKRAPFLKKL